MPECVGMMHDQQKITTDKIEGPQLLTQKHEDADVDEDENGEPRDPRLRRSGRGCGCIGCIAAVLLLMLSIVLVPMVPPYMAILEARVGKNFQTIRASLEQAGYEVWLTGNGLSSSGEQIYMVLHPGAQNVASRSLLNLATKFKPVETPVRSLLAPRIYFTTDAHGRIVEIAGMTLGRMWWKR